MITFYPKGKLDIGPPLRFAAGDPRPAARREQAVVRAVETALGRPVETSAEVDYEDWMESSAILAAILAGGHAARIRLDRYLPPIEISGTPSPDMVLGRVPLSARVFLSLPDEVRAMEYATSDVFRRHAGRRIAVCDVPGEGGRAERDLYEAITRWAGQPVVVKQVQPAKAWPLLFADVPADATADWARGWILDEVGYHFARFEGDRDALLVQDRVDMSCETRFFAVDGRIVSGAACIEAHTPIDREEVEGVTATVFERTRNEGYLFRDLSLARDLEAYASAVAQEAAQEGIGNVVIDVALGPGGKPLVVEMNPAINAGLYANDPAAIVEATIAREARLARDLTADDRDPDAEFGDAP